MSQRLLCFSVLVAVVTLPFVHGAKEADIYEGCGKSKGCFGTAGDCVSTRNCTTMVTYKSLMNGAYEFEIFGRDVPSDSYIAVGFSTDRSMGSDSVIQCVNYRGNMNAFNSYNSPSKTNLRSTVEGFSVLSASYSNGQLYCKVQQPASYSVAGFHIHFDSQLYYILLASGPTGADQIQYHRWRVPSDKEIDLNVIGETSTVQPPTTPSVLPGPIYDGCGVIKGCYGTPTNCVQSRTCTVMMTYKPFDHASYEFEIYGTSIPADNYVAVGFSTDGFMGNDSVIQCVHYHAEVNAYNAYNPAGKNNLRTTVEGFSLIAATYNDGELYCRVRQPSSYSPVTDIRIDFKEEPYHILLATGTTGADQIQYHRSRWPSPEPIWLNDVGHVTASTTTSLLSTSPSFMPDVYDGCNVTKGCFGSPGQDCIKSHSCSMLVTYQLSTADDSYVMELYATGILPDGYVAVGFSDNDKMGTDSVIQCVHYGGTVRAYNSFNTEDRNNERTTVDGFELLSAAYRDGELHCFVRQPANYSVGGFAVDFNANSYYILMATGAAGADGIYYHETRLSSSQPIRLGSANIVGGNIGKRLLKQLHGSFMITAWLVAASIGVLMPRYMKKSFNGRQVMGKDLWFVIHQGLMVTVWALTMAGFVIIFIDTKGWAGNNPHPIIGSITTSLAFIQPFMAALRPDPTARRRYVFNWAHSVVGYTAHALAMTCIFLAVEMNAAQLPFYTYWVLTAQVGFYVAAHLALTVLARGDKRAVKQIKHPSARRAVVATFGLIAVGLGTTIIVFISQS